MSRFQILPIDRSGSLAAVIVQDEGQILPAVQRLDCHEADVLKDGEYSFSARLGDNGTWCIFRRESDARTNTAQHDH